MDLMSDITEKFIKDVSVSRNALIMDRLQKLGIEFDIEEEKHRRFKRLLSEIKGNSEVIYFNDGSISGLRVIKFVTEFNNSFDENAKIGYTIKAIP
jgi:hypothetical protein